MSQLEPQRLSGVLGGAQRLGAVLDTTQELGAVVWQSGPRGYSVDYAGIVERDGTMHGPNGWTVAHPTIGKYTITHNLGLDPLAYTVVVCSARGPAEPIDPSKASGIVPHVFAQTANSFTVYMGEGKDLTTFVDAGFNFTLSPEMLAGDLIPGPPGPPGADSTVPGPPGAPGPAGPPMTVQDEGVALASHPVLNFAGAGVTAAADAPGNRITITIPGGGVGGAVDSVFGRTGAVVAASGDYTAGQVTGAVSVTGSYADPAWITSLDWTKIGNKPAIPNQTPWTSHIDGAGFELRSAGNVGIGTASPDSRITVVGNGAGGQLKIASFTDASTANGIGPLSASVFLGNHFAQNPGAILLGANSIALAVGDGSDADGQRKLTVGSNGSVGIGTLAPTSKLSFGSGAPNIAQRIALFEDAGGVGFRGIGMANPAAGVYGVGVYAGNAAPTDSNMGLFVKDNGAGVGIGTANPGSKLSVVGLPTSSAGLSAGDIWIDTAAGRVLKIV